MTRTWKNNDTQDISQFYKDDIYEDFITTLLTYLEPIFFLGNSVVAKQNSEASEAYFLMGGELNIGYNHKEFMMKNSLKLIEKAKREGEETQS